MAVTVNSVYKQVMKLSKTDRDLFLKLLNTRINPKLTVAQKRAREKRLLKGRDRNP
jgi:hypothetical protein